MWGAIKRHPLITALFTLFFIVPALFLSAMAVANNLPACKRWKLEVNDRAIERMGDLYMGGADRKKVDDAYASELTGYDEIMEQLRDTVAHEMKASRPPLCV